MTKASFILALASTAILFGSGLQADMAAAAPFFKKGSGQEQKNDDELKNTLVTVETDRGNFKMLVYRQDAPRTAAHFLALVEKGAYDGLTFHRQEQGFCVQGGDPTGTGRGGSGETIALEPGKLKHNEAGMVGLAHPLKDRDGASSQFYIMLAPANSLDGDYTLFAKVVEGLENISSEKGDKMNRVFIDGGKEDKQADRKSR